MIWRIAISIFITTAFIAVVNFFFHKFNSPEFLSFYTANLRNPLFSSFLTLGGFLFSLKTFIIVKMKENVYENEMYKKRIDELRTINPAISQYGPLKRLSDLLFWTVLFSILSALINFSVGFINHTGAAWFATAFSLFALTMFFISLIEIKGNLNRWFVFLEEAKPIPTEDNK